MNWQFAPKIKDGQNPSMEFEKSLTCKIEFAACGSTWFCSFQAVMKEAVSKRGLLVGESWKIFPLP